jgi:hypothetical protein
MEGTANRMSDHIQRFLTNGVVISRDRDSSDASDLAPWSFSLDQMFALWKAGPRLSFDGRLQWLVNETVIKRSSICDLLNATRTRLAWHLETAQNAKRIKIILSSGTPLGSRQVEGQANPTWNERSDSELVRIWAEWQGRVATTGGRVMGTSHNFDSHLKDSKWWSPFDLTIFHLEKLGIAPIPRPVERAGRICDPDHTSEVTAACLYLFFMDAMVFSRSNQAIVRLSYRFAVNFGIKN